ncbi:helix-turn-helix domain-containing protein [Metabacillus schmidteae]|uniref:helix-turn-helix domain-containing protein n=1 Tax=Metabacillus schmidteae TaxID=2730405 RepID=UPI00158A97C0|nr:helix-turn-helix transcriptional regulator [Metabacillus schmidteae]
MKSLGDRIKYYRKKKGLTRKQLCENLCDESTIFRLEKNMHVPRLDILYEIANRLNIQLEQLLLEKDEKLNKIKALCRELIYFNDYLALEMVLNELDQLIKKRNTSCPSRRMLLKYRSWLTAILLYKREGEYSEAKLLLEELVEEDYFVNEIDFDILNTLGQIHLEQKQYKDALLFFKKAYEMLSTKTPQINDYTLFPRIGYHYSLILYYMESYDKALEVGYTVLYYLEANQLIHYRGEICNLIGHILTINQFDKEAMEYFIKAELLYTLENK